jgi:trehalose 6-phosphate synthase/phosphatase
MGAVLVKRPSLFSAWVTISRMKVGAVPLETYVQLLTMADMFRSLRQSKLPTDHVFSVTVGASSKQTLASWHLVEPSDVISVISLLNGSADAGNVGAVAIVDGSVPESRVVP